MLAKNLRKVGESKWFDLVGVGIVLAAVIALGYYKTALSASWVFRSQSGWFFEVLPLIGIVSTLSAVASIMSTRLVAKVNNLGNVIGWINVIFAGAIDFLLGNAGAILTYPVSVILNWLPTKTWKNKAPSKVNSMTIFIITVIAIVGSFGLNAIAFKVSGLGYDTVYWLASVIFTLSMIADVLNVMKSSQQWYFWAVYNLVQLAKAIVQLNVANIAKYVYYILNSIVGGIVWLATEAENKH